MSGDFPTAPKPLQGDKVLDEVRAWLARFLRTVTEADLDLIALWIVHTHLIEECYTTPRLVFDSPLPGAGKTTALEHITHLALAPVQMAVVSSPAMLARLLESEMRTILIDEADRALRPDAQGTPDVLAIVNSGYKRGATRPVLVPDKEKGWVAREMSTYSPVAMAGNSPNLPEDTRSRTIRVLLIPDRDGTVEESDWELIEPDAAKLKALIERWAGQVREQVATVRPPMPAGVTGRFREKWQPLARVAAAAGGDWPEKVDVMALADVEQVAADREDGLIVARPHIVLLGHLAEIWPEGKAFMPTTDLVGELIRRFPDVWGFTSSYGSDLTVQRFGRMLATNYKVNSTYPTPSHTGKKGYRARDLADVMGRMGFTLPYEPPERPQGPEHPDADREVREATEVREVQEGTPRAKCPDCGQKLLTHPSIKSGVCIPCSKKRAA